MLNRLLYNWVYLRCEASNALHSEESVKTWEVEVHKEWATLDMICLFGCSRVVTIVFFFSVMNRRLFQSNLVAVHLRACLQFCFFLACSLIRGLLSAGWAHAIDIPGCQSVTFTRSHHRLQMRISSQKNDHCWQRYLLTELFTTEKKCFWNMIIFFLGLAVKLLQSFAFLTSPTS